MTANLYFLLTGMQVSLTLLDLDGLGPRLWAGARYAVCILSVFVTVATQETFSWQLQKIPEGKTNHAGGFESFVGMGTLFLQTPSLPKQLQWA